MKRGIRGDEDIENTLSDGRSVVGKGVSSSAVAGRGVVVNALVYV